jgi:protein-disulfide isomerase
MDENNIDEKEGQIEHTETMEHHETSMSIEQDEQDSGVPPKKDRFLPISILVAAIMIAGALVFVAVYKGSGTGSTGANNPGNTTASTTTNGNVMTLGPRDAILGNASAKVTLIEYGDYQCPFCGQYFSQTEPLIVQNYVNTGKINMVFRNFAFLGPESTAAAEAAECAEDQNKLWAYHDALYSAKVADDAKGGTEDDGFFTNALFLKLAQQIGGFNMTTFSSCITNDTDGNLVLTDKGNAAAFGVNSTPSFFIDGQAITGAQPYSVFQQALDQAVQG